MIREHGKRMGTLVTLHDIESLERIGNQLQVSERLAALGRVTAGVAHEVKNPLNSMRLWLEVLKDNMPVEPEPQQAVKMLDSEIDRLDRAVKTFLNFTKPVEMNLEETDLRAFLEEILDAARPSITKAGFELDGRSARKFPPVLVDRQLIHQAVLNLLLNACELHAAGRANQVWRCGAKGNLPRSPWPIRDEEFPRRTSRKFFSFFSPPGPEGPESGWPTRFDLCNCTMVG